MRVRFINVPMDVDARGGMNCALTRLISLMVLALCAVVMPVSAGAAVTTMPAPADIDAYLGGKGSPMAGSGSAFVASGGRWQVDPRLLVAIAGAESNFGVITCAPFNAWGYGCPNGPYQFGSWADGIDTVAQGLRENYLAEGRTSVALINLKYAPVGAANDPTGLNNNWTINVSRFLTELGGDPADIDLAGVGGTIPMGVVTDSATLSGFQFTEETSAGGADSKTTAGDTLQVAAGDPRPLIVQVRNTGSLTWRTQDVRLRRVDTESRVVGAPYGALNGSGNVAPGEVARFTVQLAASGQSDGTAPTQWRLEGPAGPFGGEITREVQFAVPAFVAGRSRVDVEAANGGIVGGDSAWTVVVHVRNAGSAAWERDGDQGVLLAAVASSGGELAREGWINQDVAARMLERRAEPGEEASFAFRVRGEVGAIAMRPFTETAWAAGDPTVVVVGSVPEDQLVPLRAATVPEA